MYNLIIRRFCTSIIAECTNGAVKTNNNKLIKNIKRDNSLLNGLKNDELVNVYYIINKHKINVNNNLNKLLLSKLISNFGDLNTINKLKLLNSLYLNNNNSINFKNNFNVNNVNSISKNLFNSDTTTDNSELLQSLNNENNSKKRRNLVIEYIKTYFLNHLEDLNNIRYLCNFIFYISSTVNNFTLSNYKLLVQRLNALLVNSTNKYSSNTAIGDDVIRVEGIIQLLWSLQKNNIYHNQLLNNLNQTFEEILNSGLGCVTLGHISLYCNSLLYFNKLGNDTLKSVVSYIKSNSLLDNVKDGDFIKLVNIVWCICINDSNNIESQVPTVTELLERVDWDKFKSLSSFKDLRKMNQVLTIVGDHLNSGNSGLGPLPSDLINLIIQSCSNNIDYKLNSKTQDKFRRILQNLNISFKSEHVINNDIVVDFLILDNPDEAEMVSHDSEQDRRNCNVVIEIDGPYHYNILLDEQSCDGEGIIRYGNINLRLNGKTIYRNNILSKLGYKLVSIPWFVIHQYNNDNVYNYVKDVLKQYNVNFKP
uniref:RAP domain containing protein, putative n=1 Tax=Theileria annulata TaxID=5874 RepID=A0A3B0MF25_THEAN